MLAGMFAGTVHYSNDGSADRRARLHRVVEASLPENYRVIIKVTGYDAALFGLRRKESFDRFALMLRVHRSGM